MVSVPKVVSQTSASSHRLVVRHPERGDAEAQEKVSDSVMEPGWEAGRSPLRRGGYVRGFSYFGLVAARGGCSSGTAQSLYS